MKNKYNIGDKVYFIRKNKVLSFIVSKIYLIEHKGFKNKIQYGHDNHSTSHYEESINSDYDLIKQVLVEKLKEELKIAEKTEE